MKDSRRNAIVQMVTKDRMVRACDLVDKYQVSMETIRRDLEYLEERGYLSRVYGGAVARTLQGLEPEYCSRAVIHYEQKIWIGKAAAKLVEEGDTIIIDVGTTTLEFARFLKGSKKITVFTNAIQIAMELVKEPKIRVIMFGGLLRDGEYSTSGFLAEEGVGRFTVDKVFLGVGGLTMEDGISDYHMEEANLRRYFVRNAQKVIALADYSKMGIQALNKVCGMDAIDVLVTDKAADKQLIAEMRGMGKTVIIASELNLDR